MHAPAPQQAQIDNTAAELRLHPPPPTVMRLSRKVLMGLAAVAVIAIFGALIWGLYQRRNPVAGTELYNTENKNILAADRNGRRMLLIWSMKMGRQQ
jgi:hypothetical protein